MKGPVASLNVTVIFCLAVCPPFGALLSLTVNAKLIALATLGITSQVVAKFPLSTLGKAGIYLLGEVEGDSDLKLGFESVEVALGFIALAPAFVCSQQ
ncbi:hypothetical protein D3C72_903430 [compost metagenome]